jgi:hypothetical protein
MSPTRTEILCHHQIAVNGVMYHWRKKHD